MHVKGHEVLVRPKNKKETDGKKRGKPHIILDYDFFLILFI